MAALPLRGRLAPSPTGHMHLGNAAAFLLAFAQVKKTAGTIVLRLEDIDAERAKAEYMPALLEDLQWLGITWDEGPDNGGPVAPYVQSERLDLYKSHLQLLQGMGLVYPCFCTRKDLRSLASAPHTQSIEYSGACRHLTPEDRKKLFAQGKRACLRLDIAKACQFLAQKTVFLPEGVAISANGVTFKDLVCGVQSFTWQQTGGDFALCRSDGVFSYQLAVVVDDGLMRINSVLRGDDLLESTPRQILLYALLGMKIPNFTHIPLLCDAEGERLAKRHASLCLQSLREAGVKAESIIGYIAFLLGWQQKAEALNMAQFFKMFELKSLYGCKITMEKDVPAALLNIGTG